MVVAAAREEAASALKRRPSKLKPKPTLAPREVADISEPEPEAEKEVVVSVVVEKYSEATPADDKKVDKKPAKSKVSGRGGREELHVPSGAIVLVKRKAVAVVGVMRSSPIRVSKITIAQAWF